MRFNEKLLHELGISKADLSTLRKILDFTKGVAGVAAFATGGQTSATRLNIHVNEISTVATTGDSVIMPPAEPGLTVTIINNGANACDVFPSVSDNLGAGVDVAVSLAAGVKIRYDCYDTTNWA